jgi:hypothetical protein
VTRFKRHQSASRPLIYRSYGAAAMSAYGRAQEQGWRDYSIDARPWDRFREGPLIAPPPLPAGLIPSFNRVSQYVSSNPALFAPPPGSGSPPPEKTLLHENPQLPPLIGSPGAMPVPPVTPASLSCCTGPCYAGPTRVVAPPLSLGGPLMPGRPSPGGIPRPDLPHHGPRDPRPRRSHGGRSVPATPSRCPASTPARDCPARTMDGGGCHLSKKTCGTHVPRGRASPLSLL